MFSIFIFYKQLIIFRSNPNYGLTTLSNTFTPTLSSDGATTPTITYSKREGYYKLRDNGGNTALNGYNEVSVYIYIVITSRSGGQGNIVFSGLPFTSSTIMSTYTLSPCYVTNGNRHQCDAVIVGGSSVITSYFSGTSTPLAIGNVGVNDEFIFSFTYLV